jgi:hypothetical protein
MKDLHFLFTNPFDDIHISFDELKNFTTDHIQRLTANPQSALTPRLAPTSAALTAFSATLTADDTKLGQRKGSKHNKNAFRATLPAAIGKIAVAVEAQFNEGSAEFLECFPHGRAEFSHCKDDKLENALQTLINGITAHQPPLAATVGTAATALLTGWQAVYAPSETATGAKTSSRDAKKAARTALSLELFKNLLTLALQFPNQPQKLDLYMQPSLLGPHTPTPPTPPPAAPMAVRDANGMWTLTYDGPAQTYWQIWTRNSDNATWSDSGDTQTSHFPAPDADIVPDGVTWWQVKFCGEDGDGNQSTPFSNAISFGPVPA